MSDRDRPAFPHQDGLLDAQGLSKREYAAITLRVPDSGQPWLDDMIRQARRMDAAQAALLANGWAADCSHEERMYYAILDADALLAALDKKEG